MSDAMRLIAGFKVEKKHKNADYDWEQVRPCGTQGVCMILSWASLYG